MRLPEYLALKNNWPKISRLWRQAGQYFIDTRLKLTYAVDFLRFGLSHDYTPHTIDGMVNTSLRETAVEALFTTPTSAV